MKRGLASLLGTTLSEKYPLSTVLYLLNIENVKSLFGKRVIVRNYRFVREKTLLCCQFIEEGYNFIRMKIDDNFH